MIISKTPYRISFFGGGSDYPDWYLKYGGQVLSTTIDKHIYITCRYLPPFFKHKHRIVWSKLERVKTTNQIKHDSVRELLKMLKINKGMEIHYDGDLPARSGMGSSSNFIVSLIAGLGKLKENKIVIISHGKMLHKCLEIYRSEANKFSCVDIIRSKPFPNELAKFINKCKGIIVVDEQSPSGNLSSCIFEGLSNQNYFPKIISKSLPEKYVSRGDYDNLVKVVHHRFDRLEEKLDKLKN